MQKWISPARILGRKNSFCSGVPKFMIVGPTVLIVSIGTGAPLRIDSSKKMNCSMAERPWPPHSFGQPMPSQPSWPIWRTTWRTTGPMPLACESSCSISGVKRFS